MEVQAPDAIEKLLTLADLEDAWPITRQTIAGHIKAGRLRAFDFSMCGKGPYGVSPADAQAFLEEYLLVSAAAHEPRADQHEGRRRTQRQVHQAQATRVAQHRAAYRI